jgi:DNA-directed RNA polymerase II subunit RPB1
LDSGPLRKCSFEETVDVFLDASAYNEIDYLTGITESIILGMTAPYGTGSFDLSIDPDVLREFAQSNADEDLAAGGTPILEDFDENNNPLGSNTDYMSRTPDYYRGG